MKIADNDLLSDETRKASRNLLFVAIPTLFVYVLGIHIDSLVIMNVPIPGDKLAIVMLVIIVYSIYILLINWYGDFAAWKTWIRTSEFSVYIGTRQPLQDYLTDHLNKLPSKFDSAHQKLNTVIHQLEYFEQNWDRGEINPSDQEKRRTLVHNLSQYFRGYDQNAKDGLVEYLKDTINSLQRVNLGLRQIKWTSGIIILINNLLLPVGCGSAAIYFIFRSPFQ